MENIRVIILLGLFYFISNLSFGQGVDWTQWRGPSGNGVSPETDWSPKALNDEKSILWNVNVGMGHSAVSVVGDKLYTFGNYELADSVFQDKIVCLNANTGTELWSYSYTCAEGEDPGPLSSTSVDNDRLYSVSREGHFICLNANNGKLIWQKHLIDEKLASADFGLISSPIVYKDLVILNINKNGAAFNKMTGELIWHSIEGKDNFSTPVFFKSGSNAYVIMQRMDETIAVNPSNGDVIWKLGRGSIADPIIYGNKMLHFVYNNMSLYNIENSPKTIWENAELKSSFQSYVKNDDFVYGFGGHGSSKLQCINLNDGALIWDTKIKEGALIVSNNILIIIGYDGKLTFAKASPEAFEIISEKQIFNMPKTDAKGRGYRRISACWTNPVLSHGKLFVRNTYGDLVCINLAK